MSGTAEKELGRHDTKRHEVSEIEDRMVIERRGEGISMWPKEFIEA